MLKMCGQLCLMCDLSLVTTASLPAGRHSLTLYVLLSQNCGTSILLSCVCPLTCDYCHLAMQVNVLGGCEPAAHTQVTAAAAAVESSSTDMQACLASSYEAMQVNVLRGCEPAAHIQVTAAAAAAAVESSSTVLQACLASSYEAMQVNVFGGCEPAAYIQANSYVAAMDGSATVVVLLGQCNAWMLHSWGREAAARAQATAAAAAAAAAATAAATIRRWHYSDHASLLGKQL
jgi:hypothetical protein